VSASAWSANLRLKLNETRVLLSSVARVTREYIGKTESEEDPTSKDKLGNLLGRMVQTFHILSFLLIKEGDVLNLPDLGSPPQTEATSKNVSTAYASLI